MVILKLNSKTHPSYQLQLCMLMLK